jgi:hypothetical protein
MLIFDGMAIIATLGLVWITCCEVVDEVKCRMKKADRQLEREEAARIFNHCMGGREE